VNRDDAIASALDAVAHHDAEVARGLHAQILGDLSLEVRRHYADEAAHHLEIRRQCVTAALQRLIGDDLTDVECADLANDLTMPYDLASRVPHRSKRPREVPGARRAARA
jgi:hypothetical protein